MYIGSTFDFDARWKYHKRLLCKGTHTNIHLQSAWNKYGENVFEFSIIEYVDKGWLVREQYYTDLLNPEYAIQKECVSSRLGVKASEETRRKLSISTKGKRNALGCKRSAAFKKNVSAAHKGKNVSEETKAKISAIMSDGRVKGENNPMSLSNREKRKNILYGQIDYR